MALLDRVKERIETDLSDGELQAMIDEAVAEIERRFGPNAQITVHLGEDRTLAADRRFLTLARPLDTGQAATAVEIEPPGAGDAGARTTLDAADWRVLHGGRTIERLSDGPNGRRFWAPLVELTYTPVSDALQRDEVAIQVAQLEIQARGLDSERAGDWQAAYPDLAQKRETLIAGLAPRRGLGMA